MRLPSKMKIRNQVLFFGLIMSILPLLFMTTYYLLQVKSDLEFRIEERQNLKIENIANQIRNELDQTFQRMEMLSVINGIEQERGLLYDFLRKNHSVEEIAIINQFGIVQSKLSRYDLNDSDISSPWANKEMTSQLTDRNRIYGEVQFNKFGKPVMKLATPISTTYSSDDRVAIGVILHLQKIIGEISSYQLNELGYIYMLDQNDQIIAHQDYTQLWRPNSNQEKEEVIIATTEIVDTNWKLVLEQPKQELLSPMYDILKKGIFAAMIIIALISVISIYAGLYFVKPIERLQKAMINLKQGKWPIEVEVTRQDELGDLSNAFNEMSFELEEKSNKLLQEKERLDIIVNSLRAGLAVIQDDHKVVWINPTLKEWLNADIGIPCYELFSDDLSKCENCLAFCPSTNEGYDETIRKLDKHGKKRIFRHRVYPLRHSSNKIKESLVLIEDITEQKEMEEVLIQTDKLSALGLMASSFAHEVNNPLATIKAYAEDLIDRLNEEPDLQRDEIKQYLSTINENTDRCKMITNNLLNFSRKSEWTMQKIDINEMIVKSIELVKHVMNKRNVHLELKFSQVPTVLGDSLNFMQVIVNIINNAVDSLEDAHGTITITTRLEEKKNNVILEIFDNGVGIEKENISKVFDPFYTSKPVGKGTGLGLSVCYGIVKQFGGTLSISSEKGEGTVVTIELPAAQ